MNVFSTAILIIFCSLLGSAFSFKCLACSSDTTQTCTGVPIDCPTDQCMTVSARSIYGTNNFASIYKSCANTALCGAEGSITENPELKIRVSVNCCQGTNCNTDLYNIPTENSTPNGVNCPSAYCEDTTEPCNTDLKMMACTGSETCCFDYRGKLKGPDKTVKDYSVKGCISPLACKCNFKCLPQMTEIERKSLECCNKVQP
ncbi:phospholipase A2 inhibitor gamma subunit B-like [Eleutherodactylus coqui]|uniref:phospholipase A2 inhibitor gamma subunit B-like n=1 Tax=Eleutherodactylus coqui TaxID=57060 RepID=UPI003461D154